MTDAVLPQQTGYYNNQTSILTSEEWVHPEHGTWTSGQLWIQENSQTPHQSTQFSTSPHFAMHPFPTTHTHHSTQLQGHSETPAPLNSVKQAKHFTRSSRLPANTTDGSSPGKPYKCEMCGKGFTRKWNLKQHTENVHLGHKGHKCPVAGCHRAFSRSHDLKKHLGRCHLSHEL
ncbi:hypothetical protein OH77DRAFT_1424309 [Trametes cingulata]|nr:hypothetical protein OH77DRAFT_1424309 [Trametes cingulata]